MKDYEDGSGLRFRRFDFVTSGQEIKLGFLVQF